MYKTNIQDIGLSEIDKNQIFLLRSLVRKPKLLIIDDVFKAFDSGYSLNTLTSIKPFVFSMLVVTNDDSVAAAFPQNLLIQDQKIIHKDFS